MNNKRRAKLKEIRERLSDLRSAIQDIRDDEDECLSNLPENLQEGDKGSTMQECIDYLEYAGDQIDDAVENLDCIIDA